VSNRMPFQMLCNDEDLILLMLCKKGDNGTFVPNGSRRV
jgi:hypothetical protein